MAEKVSLNEMIEQIRAWQRETKNFRNDSWMQESFQNRLQELFDELAPIVTEANSFTHPDNDPRLKDDKQK